MKSWYLNKKGSCTLYRTWPKYEKLRGKHNAPFTEACNPLNYANYNLINIS